MADPRNEEENIQDKSGALYSARKLGSVQNHNNGKRQRDTRAKWKSSQWSKLEQSEQQNKVVLDYDQVWNKYPCFYTDTNKWLNK